MRGRVLSLELEFIKRLLTWWRNEDRWNRYPWRTETDFYRSIVAEVLLIRTRRDVVTRVYPEFILRFPTPERLAEASEDEIADVIAPLGLRKRAKMLKRLAKELTEKLPSGPEDIEKIYGVGEYLRLILSLKLFNQGSLPVDRNVARVLWRVFRGINPSRGKPELDKEIRLLAQKLGACLPPDQRLELAYALMDFSLEICQPRKPICENCPVKSLCHYCSKGGEF
ncbi:MAG: hypothetical protein QW186_09200 [Candidatus Bathyarchaeia archaeon]